MIVLGGMNVDWLKKNWVWIPLLLLAIVVGHEIVTFLWSGASSESALSWFNKLKFWNRGAGTTTGPTASGSNCTARNEAASCVPASARVCTPAVPEIKITA